MPSFRRRALTIMEMLLTMFTVGMLGGALLLFASSSSRFIARNLATNHSHDTARISGQTLLKELRDAASSFRQLDFDGTNFNEITPTGTSDADVLSGLYAGTRSNGVRYRKVIAGPLTMTSNATPTSTTATFNFPAGTTIPIAGDKMVLPLIDQEYDVTAVSGAGTSRTITFSPALGYTLNTASPNMITGYFYRRVAFTVYHQELRFHPNFNGTNRSTYTVVRGGITSPKPFSLLFPNSGAIFSDGLSLRVSMEITDLGYSSRKFGNGTTTLYSIIPARNQPTVLSSSN